MDDKTFTLKEAEKYFGIEFNQKTWGLLLKTDRTAEEDEIMIHAAHASHLHWLAAGTKVNEQRGEWMISHVYAVLNMPERALHHAKRCMQLTEDHKSEMKDFDLGYSDEAMARALACSGEIEEAKKYYELAKAIGDELSGIEDKKIFRGDLDAGPWYGLL